MNTYTIIAAILAMTVMVSANQPEPPKADLTPRHNDALAARVNLGTAISLVVPIALGIALVSFLAPLFQSLFSPIPFGPTLGYARKGKALFEGITQEKVMSIFDTVTKAIEAYSEIENGGKAKPKSH